MERVAAVYAIRQTSTGRVYVGSSVFIYFRWHKHRELLRKGRHDSCYMQAAYDQDGLEGLVFEILQIVEDISNIRLYEQEWTDKLEAYGPKGLNAAPSAFNCKGVRTHPLQKPIFRAHHISGEVVEFANMAHFCEERGLRYANIHQLTLVSRRWHKGWRCEKIGQERSDVEIGRPQAKLWQVFPPDGEPFKVENLSRFCRKNNLDQPSLARTRVKPGTFYRGWRVEHADVS